MSTDHEELVSKLLASAASERALGNHEAADTFTAKAEGLRQKYNLPRTEPVNEPLPPEPVKEQPPKVQRRENYWDNFPGVPPPEAPLTNEQLAALRSAAAAVGGRMLTDNEMRVALGQKIEPKGEAKCHKDRYFEV
jgi:hypothetical protein